ncbi:MAG TPA: hypothetical protein VMZ92_15785 [Planctomycetota bacterium]|nr:hypothetical protein [Planctomycetota bacterium]
MIDLVYLLPLCLVVGLVYEGTHEDDMKVIVRKGLKFTVLLAAGTVLLAAVMLVLGRLL